MEFKFNDFLMSISTALDFIEMDVFSIEINHSKRVAYVALKLAQYFNLNIQEQIDTVSFSILHDNGLTQTILENKVRNSDLKEFYFMESFKEHCIAGENNARKFPFLTNHKNIIKYHHERYDGKGFFKVKGEDIPLIAQFIAFADYIDFAFKYKKVDDEKKERMIKYIKSQKNKMFNPKIVDAFLEISSKDNFWESLNDNNIKKVLKEEVPVYEQEIDIEEILKIMNVFSKIIDSKSQFTEKHSDGLANKIHKMCDNYNYKHEEKIKLVIAGKLHDIGKLAIPIEILDKPKKLDDEEILIMKKHSYYTNQCLSNIDGFEDIARWASNHHEKLNGTGYPKGLKADELDFNSRLVACLDIYQALTEERPYKRQFSHEEAVSILKNMVLNNEIDNDITNDIDEVFRFNNV
ncbi:MAG: HD domain-containing protein [Tepidibacter sp.]|jgi:HD-GYP domain-containing protein (c-di-GMP phosphodiesterase class II)|uniref:HD-GYP domain-containing protein n=1 Tax=Tepidibacter sp. TaxID=2529387 RepID=UPI0025EC11EE|nr:HD domain-containing phosphohydrolase [Tepidibacter sp.]MCT4508588.1 HD domain-containing protein [Tepidibacter sp.]